ncbi:MAG: AAA family ATPase [Lachnospiraceae bacterium]|nr:AAA family ATPase [Lachnospiraceae bacterium]
MPCILRIKKYWTESALTDFREFTMTNPGQLTEYVGFTEKEVKRLCDQYQMDFEELHIWYDGYSFHRLQHVYSPNSVMHALQNGEIQNYWTQTETFESLRSYISMDFDGLKAAITEMLGGGHIGVRISTFQNDLTSFESRNDVLTLLIHLCYLAYDSQNLETYIPNLEISEAFEAAVSGEKWETIGEAFSDSEKLLRTTLNEDADAVAESLELVHESVSSILQYHNEASLSCAVEHI